MFSKDSFISPFQQLISAFAVAKNGLPKIIEISPLGFATDSVSKMMKSTGKIKLSIVIKTSSTIPLEILRDLSANCNVIPVG